MNGRTGIYALSALFVGLSAVGCGRHQRTIYVPNQTAAGATTPSQPIATPGSGTPVLPGGTIGAPGSGSVGLPSSGTSAPPVAAVSLEALPGGSRRVASDAREVAVISLLARNTTGADAELSSLELRAEGSLDDASGVASARLVEDVDGDGRFDRAIDRAIASAGFTTDDGVASFPLREPLAAGASLRLLVTLDLTGAGRVNDTLRLRLEASALAASGPGGQPARTAVLESAGATLAIGRWVEPHLAFKTPGDGLSPKAVVDTNGNTHVSLSQNYNFNSDVWYSFFDGRSYSPVFDVSRSSATSWNQDLAVEGGIPYLAWEAWDTRFSDYGIRFARFDAGNFSWTQTEDVSGAPGVAARIAVTGGNVHVVWAERGATTAIKHRAKVNGQWTAIAEISSAAFSNGVRVETPALVVADSGEVFAAWAENGFGTSELRGRWISPTGHYGMLETVASAPQQVERPVLLRDGADLHVSYEWGGEVYLAQRTNNAWLPGNNVSNSIGASSESALVVHGGAVHVFWIEDESNGGPTSTHVAHAVAVGGAFSKPELLTRGPGARSYPTAVSEGTRLKVLWQDWSLGRQLIFNTWTEPGGLEAPRAVARPGAEPDRPSGVRARDGALAVAYALDAGGNGEIYVQVEDGPALGFQAAENVSQSATGSYKPSIAATSSRSLWVAWEESAAAGFEVQIAERTPTGWSTPAALSSATPAYAPALSGQGERLSAVWTERVASGQHALMLRERVGGAWGPAASIAAGTSASAWAPSLTHTARGDRVAAFEREERGRREVWVATVQGTGVQGIRVDVAAVASSSAGQYAPRVAARGEEVFVAWAEDGKVLVARRAPGAMSFDPPETLSQGSSWSVDLAVSGDEVLVTWEQWQGNQARPTHARLTSAGWTQPAAHDLKAVSGRRTAAISAGAGAFDLLWTEPDGLVIRQRRGS